MLQLREKKYFRHVCRSLSLLMLLTCAVLFQATTVDASKFSEAEELENFKSRLRQSGHGVQIGYLVQLNLLPDQLNDELLEMAVGHFFYKGRSGYLAHVDLMKILTLELYGISYRIIDKKPMEDQKERWYIVEFADFKDLALIQSKFEPLFTGSRAVLIRIRPADSSWLTEQNFNLFLVEETSTLSKSENKVIDLPYFSQYKNKLNPGGTCQNTCLAMILNHYGWKGTPDDITKVWGSKTAQTPEGGAKVFNSYAEKLDLRVRAKGNRAAYALFREKLGKGHPLIVHGYFTAGHVVIANSCDDRFYDCHDPAGKWNQVYKGSYNTGVSGKNQKYLKSNFDKAVAPDGNVWWVEFNPVAFVDL